MYFGYFLRLYFTNKMDSGTVHQHKDKHTTKDKVTIQSSISHFVLQPICL